jgi:hypothetical protein
MCNSQGAMGGAAASNNLPRLASGSVLPADKEVQRCNGSALNLIYRTCTALIMHNEMHMHMTGTLCI